MRYIALLRGINVGGNNKVSMDDLKKVFEKNHYSNIVTYINSGNILFESKETNELVLTENIEHMLAKAFFPIKTIVCSSDQLKNVLQNVPAIWKHENLRKYIAFIRHPTTPDDVIRETQLKNGVDSVSKGPGVVYMSTKLAGITKSGFPKLESKSIYQYITIRNVTTVQKLFELSR